jgi:hypothetical protein
LFWSRRRRVDRASSARRKKCGQRAPHSTTYKVEHFSRAAVLLLFPACATLALRATALAVRPRRLAARRRGAGGCSCAMTTAAAAAAAYTVAPLTPHRVPSAAKVLEQAFDYDSEYSWSRPLRLPQGRFALWLEHMYLPTRAAGALPACVRAPASRADVAHARCVRGRRAGLIGGAAAAR